MRRFHGTDHIQDIKMHEVQDLPTMYLSYLRGSFVEPSKMLNLFPVCLMFDDTCAPLRLILKWFSACSLQNRD